MTSSFPSHDRFQQKKRNWWIWSKQPNKGKTTWANELVIKYKAYLKGGDFSYWNVTGKEKLIILDEYNSAGLRYHTLNQLCDRTFEARVFMGGVKRLQPYITIVLSNCSISELYPFKNELLYARFIEKELI